MPESPTPFQNLTDGLDKILDPLFIAIKKCDIVEDFIVNSCDLSPPFYCSFFPDPIDPSKMFFGYAYGPYGMKDDDKKKIQIFLAEILQKEIEYVFKDQEYLHCFRAEISDVIQKFVPKFEKYVAGLGDGLKPYLEASLQDFDTRMRYETHIAQELVKAIRMYDKALHEGADQLIAALATYQKKRNRDHYLSVIASSKFIEKNPKINPILIEEFNKYVKKWEQYHPDPTKHEFWMIMAPHKYLYHAGNIAKGYHQLAILSQLGFMPRNNRGAIFNLRPKWLAFLPIPTCENYTIEANIASFIRGNKPCTQFDGEVGKVEVTYPRHWDKETQAFELKTYEQLIKSQKNNFILFFKSWVAPEQKSKEEKFDDFLVAENVKRRPKF